MKFTTQSAAVVVASGVAVASFAGPAAAAHAAHPSRPVAAHATTRAINVSAAAAAGYLARELVGPNHAHYDSSYVSGGKTITYVNYGETADAVLSMDAAGAAQVAAARATRYLEKNVRLYTGSTPATYAPGAIAKLMLVAEAQHVSVQSFGGLNLVAALTKTEGARGAAAGEYQQNAAGTPTAYLYYSTVSQALGVLALSNRPKASARADHAAITFLEDQQCADGGWPTELLSKPATACKAGSDIDSTGYAVQALVQVGATKFAGRGLHFLDKAERSNGGFGDTGAPNANSTALAIQALTAGHDSVTKPLKWLGRQQLGCGAAAKNRGAVKFQGSFDASALLATSQAGAALADVPLADIDNKGALSGAPVLTCPKK